MNTLQLIELYGVTARKPGFARAIDHAIESAVAAERAKFAAFCDENGEPRKAIACVIEAARLYVEVDGPDRTWDERKGNHEKLGRALATIGVRLGDRNPFPTLAALAAQEARE